MSGDYESAERIQDSEGRQYHIGLAPGEVEQRILTCGDPARAKRISERFDTVRISRIQREFTTFTGTFEGVPVTVMATGIGCDNTEIAVIELCQIVEEAIALYRKDGKPLPSPTSGRDSANKPQTVAWRVTFADSAPGGGSCRAEGRTILERRTGWTWTGECWTGG